MSTECTGWYEFVTPDEKATAHIAYVYEDGSVYLPEGPDVVTEQDFRLAAATDRFWRLVREPAALPHLHRDWLEGLIAKYEAQARQYGDGLNFPSAGDWLRAELAEGGGGE